MNRWFLPAVLAVFVLAHASMVCDFFRRKPDFDRLDEADVAYRARSEAIRICNEQGQMVGAFNKVGDTYTYRCVPLPGRTQ